MELATWFIVAALVSVGLGLLVASTLYFRRQMDLSTFSFTATVLFGLAIVGVVELIDAPRRWLWVGICLMWIGFYGLARIRQASGVAAGPSLGPITTSLAGPLIILGALVVLVIIFQVAIGEFMLSSWLFIGFYSAICYVAYLRSKDRPDGTPS